MANVTYIKKSIAKQYVEFEAPLSPEEYNNLGTTWQDYLDNKWVPLSKQQVKFHKDNPNATVKEVWDMQFAPTPPRTLEQAKQEKIQAINEYDNSDEVNIFYVVKDGNTLSTWFDREERADYRNFIDSAKITGVDNLELYIEDILVTVPVQGAELMLAQIQLYAGACANVTKAHKIAVEALETIEAVDAYDFETGYPERLTFTIDASKTVNVTE